MTVTNDNVIPFAFEDHLVRVVMHDGEPWMVAKDIAKSLGILWQGEKTLERIKPEWKGVGKLPTPSSEKGVGGGDQDTVIISEPAVYKLAFRSNKPEAERFTDWVASVVLPSIRKTGKFEAGAEQIMAPTNAEHHIFPDWPLDEMRTKKGIADMYRLLYGNSAAQWIAPQLGFPSPPPELVEHGRQYVISFPQEQQAA